ncbi:carbohydrate sulfotransferase 5-like [Diprion similis]|uniref:carbohydrate sulfotransferase 5-like n=1 Tax=Diprion similis TaxID=362088 RepID=UPI001EF92A52|nr:carbohydrate sulfotransferase 5-like [Diprion similis]
MSKRASFYGLISVGIFFAVYLIFNENYGRHSMRKTEPTVPVPQQLEQKNSKADTKDIVDPVSELIDQIISKQRRLISEETKDYSFPNGRYNISASKLEDLVIEKNGRPIRSVIVATWRSGSTFLGEILNAHPANYYHCEPLIAFDIARIRGPPLAKKALKWVKDLLNCEYQDLGEYLSYAKKDLWAFAFNPYLWKQCEAHQDICFYREFHSSLCKLFPFQSMKLVRLRLQIAQELLADEKLAVRMVLLVRDPRGILQSRKHREWCPPNPDCSEPALTCADMVSDFKVAVKLLKKYPTRFKVIRYEDLSLDPYKHVAELYKFYGLFFHPKARNFLESHTKANKGGVSSTFRNSKAAPFHWKTQLEFKEVKEIQKSCATAMEYWGYVPAVNATHQKEFNPLTNYVLKL